MAVQWQMMAPRLGFDVMRDKAGFVAFGRSRIDSRHAENAGAHVIAPSEILNVAFTDQLGPLKCGLPRVMSRTGFRNLSMRVGMQAVNVFGRRIDECGVGLEMLRLSHASALVRTMSAAEGPCRDGRRVTYSVISDQG